MGPLTHELAAFVETSEIGRFPQEVVEQGKLCLLDWTGAALGGSLHPAVATLLSVIGRLGGTPEATVIGGGMRTSIVNAALVNGTMSHVLDYDDAHSPTRNHPSAPLVPALLAVAEWKGLSGADLLTAYIVGFEVESRIGLALGKSYYDQGWHATGVLGRFAAAAGVGKLLGLDADKLSHALGLAATQASGLRASFGSMGKPFNAGKAASDGLLAALLAAEGFSGAPEVLEEGGGLAAVFAPQYDGTRITEGLGNDFQIRHVSLKPYASCLATHPAIDAVLELRREHRPDPAEIEAVELAVSPLCVAIASNPKPGSALAAKFSVSFCASLAMLDGRAGEDLFTDGRVADEAVQELMRKTVVCAQPSIGESEAVAEVRFRDGTRAAARVVAPKGDPRNPLGAVEVSKKFRSLAAPVLSREGVEEILALYANLEELGDVGRLVAACRRA